MVFGDPLPGDLELSLADSKSYADWLRLSDPHPMPTLFYACFHSAFHALFGMMERRSPGHSR